MRNRQLEFIEKELNILSEEMELISKNKEKYSSEIHPKQLLAFKNLLHYLYLRSKDIRELQQKLHLNGFSSLSNSESHIHWHIQVILQRLRDKNNFKKLSNCNYASASKSLELNRNILFGEKPGQNTPHLMVTMDASFLNDVNSIELLLKNGMNIARINCAHDTMDIWLKLIQKIKRASKATGIQCKIYMDLAGPKIRVQLLNKGKEDGKIKVKENDIVWLSESNAGFDSKDIVISPTEIGIIRFLNEKERIYFDDGVIKGIIEKKLKNRLAIRITRISSSKRTIKNGKGINFPDSTIEINSLTEFDTSCLPFICKYADLVGYSFVRSKDDILLLQKTLQSFSIEPPKIIIKIETKESVEQLPSLIIAGMQQSAFGIMIARGDLAVEVGFERMGELQDEILRICEAAHVPVIWATQVLENLNKSGLATRSEITDAIHSTEAECVMLNKGKYTEKALSTLLNIFKINFDHYQKKRGTFRQLKIASTFFDIQSNLKMN